MAGWPCYNADMNDPQNDTEDSGVRYCESCGRFQNGIFQSNTASDGYVWTCDACGGEVTGSKHEDRAEAAYEDRY